MCLSHVDKVDLQHDDHSHADIDGPLQDGSCAQDEGSVLSLYL